MAIAGGEPLLMPLLPDLGGEMEAVAGEGDFWSETALVPLLSNS